MENNNNESDSKSLYRHEVVCDVVARLKSSRFDCRGSIVIGEKPVVRLQRHDASTGRTTIIDISINKSGGGTTLHLDLETQELITGCKVILEGECEMNALAGMDLIRSLMRETIRHYSQPRDHLIILNQMKSDGYY